MTPAVRASKTFRRLTASETLNDFGQAAFTRRSQKTDIRGKTFWFSLRCTTLIGPSGQYSSSWAFAGRPIYIIGGSFSELGLLRETIGR